ncbi:MAG TPA: TMEM175 family protein [Chitinophagaceae bacterium]|nr:TMEM175 family protein [Chitinophagaceae bacterium]
MIRNKIFGAIHHEKFRHRATEILRIEALSDAVFAFSVSLLVVSLQVPQTFSELIVIVNGGLAFVATVAILFLLWYQQYIFFRHYGLNDVTTIILNLVYLAVILFYLYPLKFLFSVLLTSWTGINLFPGAAGKNIVTHEQFPQVIILFSIGYFVIWLLLYLMHKRALHYSQEIHLNQYEIIYTRKETRGALLNAMVGIVATLLAWKSAAWLSGICYFLIPVVLFYNELLFKRQIKKAIYTAPKVHSHSFGG